jgi:hypothetical protein
MSSVKESIVNLLRLHVTESLSQAPVPEYISPEYITIKEARKNNIIFIYRYFTGFRLYQLHRNKHRWELYGCKSSSPRYLMYIIDGVKLTDHEKARNYYGL